MRDTRMRAVAYFSNPPRRGANAVGARQASARVSQAVYGGAEPLAK